MGSQTAAGPVDWRANAEAANRALEQYDAQLREQTGALRRSVEVLATEVERVRDERDAARAEVAQLRAPVLAYLVDGREYAPADVTIIREQL